LEPRQEQIASAREATDVAPPAWVTASPLLASAYSLAESAHRHQRRPTDGRLFLDHVTEVATFLHEAAFDERLVAVGLLHDSVERGSLSTDELRGEMGEEIASFVMALTEDATIDSFEMRKAALRDQVRGGGEPAVTVFAADKLSDIIGLRRGIGQSGQAIEERMGTTIAGIAGHYSESVELIGSVTPRSTFLPALREQLDRLVAESSGS
jgi:HD domain